jgi:hypothetical protein
MIIATYGLIRQHLLILVKNEQHWPNDMTKKVYRPKLEQEDVDGYWKILGMAQEAWMDLSEASRVQLAWTDMIKKSEAVHKAYEEAQRLSSESD